MANGKTNKKREKVQELPERLFFKIWKLSEEEYTEIWSIRERGAKERKAKVDFFNY